MSATGKMLVWLIGGGFFILSMYALTFLFKWFGSWGL
jgi:hypothetical protein